LGLAQVNLKVTSSIISNATGEPSVLMKGSWAEGVNWGLRNKSSYQNRISSAVKGAPSLQRMPSRSLKVNSVASSLTSTDSAILGITSVQSGLQRIRFS